MQPFDVVCGRGAPTNFHPGNQSFRDIVKEYETEYLCSKRSEKPRVAMRLMEMFRSQGVRFVRRQKLGGRSAWIEIGDERVYEKICQALREGATELRRKMLSSEAKKAAMLKKMEFREEENYSPIPVFF